MVTKKTIVRLLYRRGIVSKVTPGTARRSVSGESSVCHVTYLVRIP